MSALICPACGKPTTGPYCSHCGVNVADKITCAACGSVLPPEGRYCNQCGAPTVAASVTPEAATGTAPAPRAASTLPWVIAGLAILALVLALVFPRPDGVQTARVEDDLAAPATNAGAAFGDASSIDLSAMSPRERADNLFNRVMQNVSAGDSTQARFFLPMALAAYADVPQLDADGHYHVAVLHLAAGDPAAARVSADSILTNTPDHLFGLFTAAQAEQAMGNPAAARALYARFSERFDAEVAVGRAEYSEHQAVMPMMQEEARQALEGS